MTGSRARAVLAAAAVALGVAASAPVALAEAVRVEAVGVAAVEPRPESGESPRQAATRDALRGAVHVVARQLLAGRQVPPEELERILGPDPYPYLVRFRVLEDRGERPRLLHPDPAVSREHVIRVEATVDAERVRRALSAAGIEVGDEAGEGGADRLRLVLDGVTRWADYQVARTALEADGARVEPLEFAPGRIVIAVETRRSSRDLLERLRRTADGDLRVVPVAVGPTELHLRVGASRGARRGPGTGAGR